MRVATMVSSGKDLSFESGQFVLEGQVVSVEKVAEYDGLGIIQWVSSETRDWFQALRTRPTPVAAPAAVPLEDPRIEVAIKGRKQLLIGTVLFAAYALIGLLAPIAALANGRDAYLIIIRIGVFGWFVGLFFGIGGFLKVSPVLRMPGIVKVLIVVGYLVPMLDAVLGAVLWSMAMGAIASPAPAVPESERVGWAYGLGRWIGRSGTNRAVAIVGAVLIGLLLVGGVLRIGGNILSGVGPNEAIGTAMPPNEVLVDGTTYSVLENKSGTNNILRGDKVKIEFKDIDSDGENDMVNIVELVSVAGQ